MAGSGPTVLVDLGQVGPRSRPWTTRRPMPDIRGQETVSDTGLIVGQNLLYIATGSSKLNQGILFNYFYLFNTFTF